MEFPARILGALTLCTLVGCAAVGPREAVRFEAAPRPAGADSYPNWVRPPDATMRDIQQGSFEVVEATRTAQGTGGAYKTDLLMEGTRLQVKDKRVPPDLDGINNAPRKELAAYAIQKFFLDSYDYLVPATALRCVPIETWREFHGATEKPTLPNGHCVLVMAALWLEDVTLPKPLYDRERFLTEPTYAYYMSNFNVLTYLIEHQDGREGNFLVSKDNRRQVFAIDNGVSFGQPWPYYNWFVPNWNVLRVPAVRKDTIDRVRRVQRKDLDTLLVVAQLEGNGEGVLVNAPSGPPIDADEGASLRGTTMQFGLTKKEIDDVWKRIQSLIEDVDSGQLPVF